jgi:hypothetical protein
MAHFIEIDLLEFLANSRVLLGPVERELPVLDLRVTAEQKPA